MSRIERPPRTTSTTEPQPQALPRIDGMMPDRFFMTSLQITEMTQTLAQEMMSFTERRMRAQMAFMGELPRCTEPQELVTAQLRFIAEASRDYADEINQVAQVLRRLGEAPERPPSKAA